MLLNLHEATVIGYTELKGLDVFEFMILYNLKVQQTKKQKAKNKE
jgi:hypothetical protein